MTPSVLITGATGNTGKELTAKLVESGVKVRAGSRNFQKQTINNNMTVPIKFDWFDPSTHDAALKGVECMYLVPPPGVIDPVPIMKPFLHKAKRTGVRRVILLSATVIQRGDRGLGQIHEELTNLFPEWTVLRPSWFMQNFTGDHPHATNIRENNLICTATENGRIGFIDAYDIANVAFHALITEKPLNRDLILTGPEALSYNDIAEVISTVREPAVQHQQVSLDQLQQLHTTSGLPEEFANMLAHADQLIANGFEDRVTNEVEAITGTPPVSFAHFASKHWSKIKI
ncbi:NmrA family NAD(P)-binding protein [Alkalicoccobacillus porphyridii]|uniref:Ergot alkaloid biosynthesis protein n=1 Tax=Alkalicoccobacillus porphyridii TaxID=2597270 RepID=A0A554A295_9BACI|nr:NAD(P)H-binding protein [Alkalicoccobacillus porphyridii]TSB47824.1 ergot alkaloid biosynthesis protein [Alkalicoccobacillus porphyridii]